MGTRDHKEEKVGYVAALLTSSLPVEENHGGCQATKEAEDDTEWCDDIDQERDGHCFESCGLLFRLSVNNSQISSGPFNIFISC